jgi:hypothetical protein
MGLHTNTDIDTAATLTIWISYHLESQDLQGEVFILVAR